MVQIRKGQYTGPLSREAFHGHYRRNFYDPAYEGEEAAIARLEEIAWKAYCEGRKAPRTQPAGPGFADPDYRLSDEWRATRDRLAAAEARQKSAATKSRVLLICASSRNDGSCPGEISKTFRLANEAEAIFKAGGVEVDRLDLSQLTSEYGRKIHPCKACVSTAMPLCHWPCSCYPNHALCEADDWMAEIYEQWTLAHGVMIVTPVYWDQAPSGLKLMIDRLVCADGGNPDPTTTSGKDPKKAKALELAGWSYPKHLAGRVYGLAVHGDVAGAEQLRRTLTDWLDWLGFVAAGSLACIDRYIGYYQPYATSHEALDKDEAVVEEVRNVARSVVQGVADMRAGKLIQPGANLSEPRKK